MTHYTPTMEQLIPNHKIKCSQPNCDTYFTNVSNYKMHLLKRHQITTQQNLVTQRYYHCPVLNCIYHIDRVDCKHFKNMKYLRQHYQKLHLDKVHVCERCEKKFPTLGLLQSHQQNACGRKFICLECGWDYESVEALQTHCKRKGHLYRREIRDSQKGHHSQLQQLKRPLEMYQQQDQQTQTEDVSPVKRFRMAAVQTDITETVSTYAATTGLTTPDAFSNDLDDIQSFLRDIETQTEFPMVTTSTATATQSNSEIFDQILAHSTHMHTQTCDDFLTELGLADIQTQTNWSTMSVAGDEKHHHAYSSIATSTNCAHDELLVSTETQTSFTQNFLASCPSDSGGGDDATNLYHTQHTQTCDMLLENFGLFGSQENDLIGGFHSTYTQT